MIYFACLYRETENEEFQDDGVLSMEDDMCYEELRSGEHADLSEDLISEDCEIIFEAIHDEGEAEKAIAALQNGTAVKGSEDDRWFWALATSEEEAKKWAKAAADE